MPGIVRLGDMSTGHGCFPPQASVEASPDVFVDGLPVVTVRVPGWMARSLAVVTLIPALAAQAEIAGLSAAR